MLLLSPVCLYIQWFYNNCQSILQIRLIFLRFTKNKYSRNFHNFFFVFPQFSLFEFRFTTVTTQIKQNKKTTSNDCKGVKNDKRRRTNVGQLLNSGEWMTNLRLSCKRFNFNFNNTWLISENKTIQHAQQCCWPSFKHVYKSFTQLKIHRQVYYWLRESFNAYQGCQLADQAVDN